MGESQNTIEFASSFPALYPMAAEIEDNVYASCQAYDMCCVDGFPLHTDTDWTEFQGMMVQPAYFRAKNAAFSESCMHTIPGIDACLEMGSCNTIESGSGFPSCVEMESQNTIECGCSFPALYPMAAGNEGIDRAQWCLETLIRREWVINKCIEDGLHPEIALNL